MGDGETDLSSLAHAALLKLDGATIREATGAQQVLLYTPGIWTGDYTNVVRRKGESSESFRKRLSNVGPAPRRDFLVVPVDERTIGELIDSYPGRINPNKYFIIEPRATEEDGPWNHRILATVSQLWKRKDMQPGRFVLPGMMTRELFYAVYSQYNEVPNLEDVLARYNSRNAFMDVVYRELDRAA